MPTSNGAQITIAHLAIRTPTLYSHALSQLCGADIFLKLELLQRGGSFKVRGAANMIARLAPGTSIGNSSAQFSPRDSKAGRSLRPMAGPPP